MCLDNEMIIYLILFWIVIPVLLIAGGVFIFKGSQNKKLK